jgi:hypothetical protein
MRAVFEDTKRQKGGWDTDTGLGLDAVRRILQAIGVPPHNLTSSKFFRPIAYLPSIKIERFEKDFLGRRPVLVRRPLALNGSYAGTGVRPWLGFGRWTRKGVVHRYGKLVVSTGEIPYGVLDVYC